MFSREEAHAILREARRAATHRGKWRVKPGFNVSMRKAAILKRLAVYRDRLHRLTEKGLPPTLLLANSISRDVAVLDKLHRAWEIRHWRSMSMDRPE